MTHKPMGDDEAMSIIRRAAVILQQKVCETPGCRYTIRIADGYIFCAVRLPEDANPGLMLQGAPEAVWQGLEDHIHDMMSNAVAEVMKQARARSSASTPTTPTPEDQQS